MGKNQDQKEKNWFDLILYIWSFIMGLIRKNKEEDRIEQELQNQQFSEQIADLNHTYEENADNHKPPTDFQSSVDYLNDINKK